ncbi:MAG: LLM class flavin-dependent oxidoreductase [Acidimicrobiales bacterium]
MNIGLSVSSTHKGSNPRSGPNAMIGRVRAAHEAGLSSMTVGDHHNMPYPYVQNTPMLGRLLAEWPGRPAGALFLLPLWNPVLAAEHIGTLAATHDGPFIVQSGIGSGDEQFVAFGARRQDRGARLDESIRVIKALLRGERVDSPMFGVDGGRVGLLPPEPVEWWVGAGADVALDRAAREGHAWYASPGLPFAAIAERIDRYRERCAHHGRDPLVKLRRDVLVLDDATSARSLADEIFAAGYRGLGLDQVIVGGVDEAIERCSGLADLGVDEVVMRCMSPDETVARETIEVMGRVQAAL